MSILFDKKAKIKTKKSLYKFFYFDIIRTDNKIYINIGGKYMAENKNENCNSSIIQEFMNEIFKTYLPEKDNLIQILNEIQDKFGYIPELAQKETSKFLKIPMAEIYGVITFYSRFTLEPKGKYTISVCLGTACYVKGSQKIIDRLKERLKIEPGQTTEDGLFSIDQTRCVGSCGLAPVFTVNGEVYGKATVKKLDEVLDELMKNK